LEICLKILRVYLFELLDQVNLKLFVSSLCKNDYIIQSFEFNWNCESKDIIFSDSDWRSCDCYDFGTKSCSNLNGVCECKEGYDGYNCETCADFYSKNSGGECKGQYH